MSLKEAIMAGRTAIENAEEWAFDRTKFLNASEADYCIRQLWYMKHTPEAAKPQEWGFARRGTHAEKYVIESLLALNSVEMRHAGDEQMSYQLGRLSATPDGTFRVNDGPWMGIEVKSMDPRTNRSNLPKAAHVHQLQIAMALYNAENDTEYHVTEGVLMYIDASNFDDIVEFPVPLDPAVIDAYSKKADKVFRTKSADALDREGKRERDGCKYCPFTETCGVSVEEAEGAGRRRANRGSKFDEAAKRYMQIKADEDALELEKKMLAEDIKTELSTRNVSRAVVGDIEVTLSAVAGRTTLDKKAVAKAGIDLSPYEKKGAPSERLLVQPVSG